MLNPDKIRDIEFEQSVLGGYRRDEVDHFLDEVEVSYRKLYIENAEMAEKLKACLAKIENYRKDEEFLKTAIINAQRLNETTLREIELREKEAEISSKEKAAQIIAEAEQQARELVHKAEVECADAVQAARDRSKAEIEVEQRKADEMVRMIRRDAEAEQKKLDYLKSQVAEFKNMILEIYKSHLTSISKLPDFKASVEPEKAAVEPIPSEEPVTEAESPVKSTEPAPTAEEAAAEQQAEAASSEGNTVEFKLEPKVDKKKKAPKEAAAATQLKFENFKFGVDYDINNDE